MSLSLLVGTTVGQFDTALLLFLYGRSNNPVSFDGCFNTLAGFQNSSTYSHMSFGKLRRWREYDSLLYHLIG